MTTLRPYELCIRSCFRVSKGLQTPSSFRNNVHFPIIFCYMTGHLNAVQCIYPVVSTHLFKLLSNNPILSTTYVGEYQCIILRNRKKIWHVPCIRWARTDRCFEAHGPAGDLIPPVVQRCTGPAWKNSHTRRFGIPTPSPTLTSSPLGLEPEPPQLQS